MEDKSVEIVNTNYMNVFSKMYNEFEELYNKGLFQETENKIQADDILNRLDDIVDKLGYVVIKVDDFNIFDALYKELNKMFVNLEQEKKGVDVYYLSKINKSLYAMQNFISMKRDVDISEKISDILGELRTEIFDVKSKIEEEAEDFRRKRNIADNAKTENIYDQAVIKYRGLEEKYRVIFYWAIALTVGLSLFMFLIKNPLVDRIGEVEFWVIKVSILAVGITLITYFLKQSAHYQRLADQNYQTQVELQAYPSFMESIPTNEAASVRKELALKYFGREIDGAAHKDMSNLISDQMKSTTEMVKAATDVLKVNGGK